MGNHVEYPIKSDRTSWAVSPNGEVTLDKLLTGCDFVYVSLK